MNFISNDKYIVSGFIDGNLVIINSADMTIIFQTIINREFEKLPENLDSGNSVFIIFIIFFLFCKINFGIDLYYQHL